MIDDLRIHAADEPSPRRGGDHVLYWMQSTFRAQQNHALEFAVTQANQLGLPLLVYHGLRHDYPWASDRHHTFLLETAADLALELEALGIQYAFYLERDGDDAEVRRAAGRPSPLVALAGRAALVVTDYFPTFLAPRQTRALRRKVETPVIAVDSATVVPVRYFERGYPTAPPFRARVLAALPRFLAELEPCAPWVRAPVDLPFEPTATAGRIAELVAACDVDHTVGPAPGIRGGPRAARDRLDRFLRDGLPRYEEGRSDPTADATSGLSPYLHFGNLSPIEVLRRAREAGPDAAFAKFRDELLTWRELAFNFTHFDPHHRTVSAIPDWARRELAEHEADPRPARYSADDLEQARTAEPLWNAAQRAYLRDGWMPNALRMLWGKAVIQWTRTAGEALAILEHLNNKYSLDGRDPSTYLNLQWVFGKFDRPFYRRPIYGTVRYLSLRAAEKKFDVARVLARYGSL
ncbi:MAG TPA: deoxyribodipyrimidine photo-lyase [Gemmatimonadales bacterium]|jgi:photolyase PhrII|nr:deoxyribodipyrimidine photo-lyase [Gemmatimonadales bacterium]